MFKIHCPYMHHLNHHIIIGLHTRGIVEKYPKNQILSRKNQPKTFTYDPKKISKTFS